MRREIPVLMLNGERITELKTGDHVKYRDQLFDEVREAVVGLSYKDQYGGSSPDNDKQFSFYTSIGGESAWHTIHCVTEILGRDQLDLVKQWVHDREVQDELHSGLEWIFNETVRLKEAHPEDWYRKLPGASYRRLGYDLGIADLWGGRGEAFTYMQNLDRVARVWARAFGEITDVNGWLPWVENARKDFEATRH